jgi:hypothetical protein
MPLNLAPATPETAWAIPEPPPPPVRMAANATPAFEVATIKPSDPWLRSFLLTLKSPALPVADPRAGIQSVYHSSEGDRIDHCRPTRPSGIPRTSGSRRNPNRPQK